MNMTRVENEKQPTEREALKKEILQEIHGEERRKKLLSCAGCLALELLAVAAPLLISAVLIAKTGLVTIPILTNWLYAPSQPVRQITRIAGSTGEQIGRAEALKAKYDPVLQLLDISFTEAELTTLVQGSLDAAGGNLPFSVSNSQIAVEPGHLEFFGLLDRPDRKVTVRAEIEPSVQNGQLKIKVTGLRIGALGIPDSLSGLFSSLLERVLGDALTSAMAELGQLNSIELEKGRVLFRIHYVPPR